MNKARTFLFFGMSGSGKGTQAKLLEEYLQKNDPDNETLLISTGSIIREFVKSETFTANKVKSILDEGGLLPAFLPIFIWTDFLDKRIKTNKENLILDGLARKASASPILDGALTFYDRSYADIIVINVSREWATDKLKKRGRNDDSDEGIKERLEWYDSNVKNSIDYFRNQDSYKVHEINGEQAIPEVHKEILEKVG